MKLAGVLQRQWRDAFDEAPQAGRQGGELLLLGGCQAGGELFVDQGATAVIQLRRPVGRTRSHGVDKCS